MEEYDFIGKVVPTVKANAKIVFAPGRAYNTKQIVIIPQRREVNYFKREVGRIIL